jgi:hypothetical protein
VKYRITYKWGTEWIDDEIRSAHYLDDDTIRTFQDFLSSRNITQGDVPDLELFLETKGVLLSGSFSQTLPLRKSSMYTNVHPASLVLLTPLGTPVPQPGGRTGKIKKIFVCIYGPYNTTLEDVKNILTFLAAETDEIFIGLIIDENPARDTFTVKILAICSGD